MPNGQAHLMVNLAEDEFRTYGGSRADQKHRRSGTLAAEHGLFRCGECGTYPDGVRAGMPPHPYVCDLRSGSANQAEHNQ